MSNHYESMTQHFETIIDFLRFGICQANRHGLYYGHGTDNVLDDITALIFDSLMLPFDTDDKLLASRLTEAEKQVLVLHLYKRVHERIPTAYLTNTSLFCGLSFYVDERVLIPRSPIAELINQHFSPWVDEFKVSRVLDLCTGSGCIAIACSYAFPMAAIDAVDISTDALEVAAMNCERHGLFEEDVKLIASDCWDNVPNHRYDIIVSNPPYVSDDEMETLPEEYRHEPDMALRTEHNGLAIVEKILARAHEFLTPEGILVVEVGNTEDALVEAYPTMPFTWLEFEHGGHGVFLLTYDQLKTFASDHI